MTIIDDLKNEMAETVQEAPAVREWRRCRPYIEDALKGSFFTIEHVEDELSRPGTRVQFWPGKNCAVVTELQVKGAEVILYCWLAGGDMAEILAMAPGIEAAGRLMGATSVLVEGRRGWEKVLKGDGYALDSITLRKAL